MLALTPDLYERWRSVERGPVKFFLRLWLDALFHHTHVHWRLPPLSVLMLAEIWAKFHPTYLASKRRFSKNQLDAIRAMARRRAYVGNYYYSGKMPRFEDPMSTWDDFFRRQLDTYNHHAEASLGWCKDRLVTGKANPSEIYHRSCDLISSIYLHEVFDTQIFLGMTNFVLDPLGKQAGEFEERLVDLLQGYFTPPSSRMIAYTELFPTGKEFHTRASQVAHWSSLFVTDLGESLDQVAGRMDDGSTVAMRLETRGYQRDYRPLLVTTAVRRGGMGEFHRRRARLKFAEMIQEKPVRSSLVFPVRSHFREFGYTTSWYHDASFANVGVSSGLRGVEVGVPEVSGPTKLYHNAASVLLDFPEESLWHLMVGVETRWGRYREVANAYRWALRTRLGQDVWSFGVALSERFSNVDFPEASCQARIKRYFEGGDTDYERIRQDEAVRGLVLIRLEEICDWYSDKPEGKTYDNSLSWRCHTWREIEDLLTLGRGLRNLVAHSGFLEERLYGLSLYVATVACEAFMAGVRRDLAGQREGK